MNVVKAKYEKGQIVLAEPVDWPDGTELRVEPLVSRENGRNGLVDLVCEVEQGDDPQSVARWLEWYDSLEPLILTPEEEADIAAWRQKVKDYTIRNMYRGIEDLFE